MTVLHLFICPVGCKQGARPKLYHDLYFAASRPAHTAGWRFFFCFLGRNTPENFGLRSIRKFSARKFSARKKNKKIKSFDRGWGPPFRPKPDPSLDQMLGHAVDRRRRNFWPRASSLHILLDGYKCNTAMLP